MKPEIEIHGRIEKYLHNELSAIEKSVFESEMNSNSSFAEEVEKHRLIHELLVDEGLIHLKQKMKSGQFNPPGYTNKRWWYSGGTIVLLLLSAIIYFKNQNLPSAIPATDEPIGRTQSNPLGQAKKKAEKEKANKILPAKNETLATSVPDIVKSAHVVVPDVAKGDTIREVPDLHIKPIDPGHETSQLILEPIKKADTPAATGKVSVKTLLLSEEKTVEPAKNTSYIIFPERGELWDVPLDERQNTDLKIFNVSGEMIYNVTIRNGWPHTWNATNKDGTAVNLGTYVYVITGENGTVQQGTVTVAR